MFVLPAQSHCFENQTQQAIRESECTWQLGNGSVTWGNITYLIPDAARPNGTKFVSAVLIREAILKARPWGADQSPYIFFTNEKKRGYSTPADFWHVHCVSIHALTFFSLVSAQYIHTHAVSKAWRSKADQSHTLLE